MKTLRHIQVLRGNPTAEEQAAISAYFLSQPQKNAVKKPADPWVQNARRQELERWPATCGDRAWQQW